MYELQVPPRDCHVGLRPPRNDKSEAFAILTVACTDCKCVAGPGCPLPYNGVYGRREYPEICSCHRRSVSAATDAIGLYVFTAACTDCECLPEIATSLRSSQ